MPVAVRIEGVVKRYGRTAVLNGVDLIIDQGESVGLVGVNGAGKTTLIKALLDLCEIERGSIDLFGVSHLKPEARKRIGFLPEKFLPPYFATGKEYLRFMARLHGRPVETPAIQEVLATLDLEERALSKPVRELSKGMAQKLGLAAVLLCGKDLFVLDEPMSGLDPRARASLRRHLAARRAAGGTLLFTSHLLADVADLCDRMLVLHPGRVLFAGRPEVFREEYGGGTLEDAYLACLARGATPPALERTAAS
ncbi:MAG: ABC transporter ATP-binding protein [Gammaproteobacteria bacterium]